MSLALFRLQRHHLLAAVFWILPSAVFAQALNPDDPASNNLRKSTQATVKPYNLSAAITSSLGTGSFAASSYKNHYFAQSLDLSASVRAWKYFSFVALWGFDVEYTQPDNESGRRFFPRDVTLAAAWATSLGKYVSTRISLGMQLPTSLASQVATRYLRTTVAGTLNGSFGPVSVSYAIGLSKDFNRYTSPVFDQSQADLPSVLLRQSTRENIDLSIGLVPMPGTRNISWLVRNSFALNFTLYKGLSLGFAFSIFNAFKYPSPDDAYRATIPTVNGNVKADLVGRLDFTMGDISLNWAALPYLQFALGAISMQMPLTDKNNGLRIPFLNVFTANDNVTTFYLRIVGSY